MNKISKVLFVGSKQLGIRVLQEINLLSPDTLVGAVSIDDTEDTRSVFKEFQDFSYTNKVKLYIAQNRKHLEQIINDLQPDLCLVVCWYWLLSSELLKSVPNGFIGVHNSLLPKYRGGSPLTNQIINNEKEVGFSCFSLTPGMDDGKVWVQGRVIVGENDYISDVLRKLEIKTIEVLRENYLLVLNEAIRPVQQKHELATYCTQRFPEDGNIDWNKSAWEVYNFVRAQSDPYPGAFTYCKDLMIKIWKAKVFNQRYYGTPGQIARISDEGVYVICGNNTAIILEEIEDENIRERANKIIKSIKTRFSRKE